MNHDKLNLIEGELEGMNYALTRLIEEVGKSYNQLVLEVRAIKNELSAIRHLLRQEGLA